MPGFSAVTVNSPCLSVIIPSSMLLSGLVNKETVAYCIATSVSLSITVPETMYLGLLSSGSVPSNKLPVVIRIDKKNDINLFIVNQFFNKKLIGNQDLSQVNLQEENDLILIQTLITPYCLVIGAKKRKESVEILYLMKNP